MSLLMFEMKKLFLKRTTAIVAVLFILIPLVPNVLGELSYYRNYGSPRGLYEAAAPHEGRVDPVLAAKADEELKRVLNRKLNGEEPFGENSPEQVSFYFDYHNAFFALEKYKNGDVKEDPMEPYSLAGVQKRMETLEKEGRAEDYEYRMRVKQYKMLSGSGEPEFYYKKSWNSLYSFLTMGSSFLFIVFLLLLVVSPVFSTERATGMDAIILSTRNGRVKAVTAKLAASVIFTAVFVAVYNLVQLAGYIGVGGVMGWDAPLKSILGYTMTPYNITMLQYFMLQLVLQLVGSIILTLTIAFISSKCKSSLSAFFVSLIAIFYPLIFGQLLRIRADWFQPIIDLSVFQLASVHSIFAGFKAYNLFGSPVLYVFVLIPFAVVAGTILVWLTYREVRKQQV